MSESTEQRLAALEAKVKDHDYELQQQGASLWSYDEVVRTGKMFVWALMNLAESVKPEPGDPDFERHADQAMAVVADDTASVNRIS